MTKHYLNLTILYFILFDNWIFLIYSHFYCNLYNIIA